MKVLLVATTALVCITSLAAAGTLPERQSGLSSGKLDTNGEFLCNYGFTIHTHVSSSFFFVKWERAATPVLGKGKSVNEIVVDNNPSGDGVPSGFRIAIYSSYANKPDRELVAASATSPECGRLKVPIPAITLEKGKKYWIVQRVLTPAEASSTDRIVWLYDKTRSHGALKQSGSSVCSSTCSSRPGPWKPIAGGVPYARVRESVEALEHNRPPRSQHSAYGFEPAAVVQARRGGYNGNIQRHPP